MCHKIIKGLVLQKHWKAFFQHDPSDWSTFFFFCSETTFTLMCVTGRYCRAMNLHTSVTSCWILWWAGKVGWPQHQTSCTFEWIVRAERKAGDSKRLWTAAKSASTPCPAWPFFFSCCWTRCSAAVTSCKPIREVAQLENVNYGESSCGNVSKRSRAAPLPTIFCMPLLSR